MVHQIAISGRNAIPELNAIVDIHQALNHPGTQSGGYNTLGFDDEMLRFAFYRNLLTPYTHQYQDGCGRFDILPMVLFYYLYAPDTIKWPQKTNGRPSFKLEDLNQENNWVKGRAHDAMVDVEATVALMRHLRVNRPMWDYMMGYFDKEQDLGRIQDLSKQAQPYQGVGIMVDLKFGYLSGYQVPLKYIGPHHVYKNQHVFLRLDKPIEELNEENFLSYIVKKKLAEPGFVLPYLDRYKDKLSEDMRAMVERNLANMQEDNLQDIMQKCRQQTYEDIADVDLDAYLYQSSFLTREEQLWCEQFHLSGQNAREMLLENVTNDVLKEQALRFLWRFYPEQLPDHLRSAANQSIKQFLSGAVDYRKQYYPTADAVLSRINHMDMTAIDEHVKQGLIELKEHTETVLTVLDEMD